MMVVMVMMLASGCGRHRYANRENHDGACRQDDSHNLPKHRESSSDWGLILACQ
jgi:hypothetical protein